MQIAFSLVVRDDSSPPLFLLEMLRDAGFQGIEPTLMPAGSLPCVEDARNTAHILRERADRVGLKIPSMRGGPRFWPTFASADSAKRQAAVELAHKALDAVKIMGGDTLLIVPGQWDADQSYESVWRNALDTAKRIAEVAEKVGVTVGLENVENRFLLSPREWMQFLDEVGSPRVRMYFDVGNVVYLSLGHPEQWLLQLGKKYITRIHFKDANPQQVRWLLDGQVNWSAISSAIREIGYDDWLGVELNLPAHHPAAMLAGTYRAAAEILK